MSLLSLSSPAYTSVYYFTSSVFDFDLSYLLIFHRGKAGAGGGCSAGGKGCPASGKDHGQRGDLIRRSPVVLCQPLQRHQATSLTQAAHDLHMQGRSTRGRQRQGPTGSHQGQWSQGDRCVTKRIIFKTSLTPAISSKSCELDIESLPGSVNRRKPVTFTCNIKSMHRRFYVY